MRRDRLHAAADLMGHVHGESFAAADVALEYGAIMPVRCIIRVGGRPHAATAAQIDRPLTSAKLSVARRTPCLRMATSCIERPPWRMG